MPYVHRVRLAISRTLPPPLVTIKNKGMSDSLRYAAPHQLAHRALLEARSKNGKPPAPPGYDTTGYGLPPIDQGSQRSTSRRSLSQRSGTQPTISDRTSMRSITSSVALGKLNKLEELLLQERKAREEAESTLITLQRERASREEATRKAEHTKQQLDDVMLALRQVVSAPDDPRNVSKLHSLLQGRPPSPSPSERARLKSAGNSPPTTYVNKATSQFVAQYNRNVPGIDDDKDSAHSSARNVDAPPRSFIDNMGHFERTKEREHKKLRAANSKAAFEKLMDAKSRH